MAHARFAYAPRIAVLAATVIALGWALVAIVAVDPSAEQPTTHGAAHATARIVDIAAGLGLVLAGTLAWTQPHARRLGLLATLAGIAWFGPDVEGWMDGPSLMRSLGALVAPMALVVVAHIALAVPGGRLRTRRARAAVGVAYGIAAAIGSGLALFRNPLLDLYCWRNCSDNAFLAVADPGVARALTDLWVWSALTIAVGLLAIAAHRLLVASGPSRRVLAPVVGPAMLVGVCEAVYAVAVLRTPLEDPAQAGFAAIFVARSLAFTGLAFGVAWSVLRVLRTRVRVARLARDLGEAPAPGTLRDALRAAVGDPELDVLYPCGDAQQLVGTDGRRRDRPVDGRAVAQITRDGRPLAVVLHDPVLVDEHELERALGSAARLAIENEALHAEALSQVHDLCASRTRIVETADAARRGLERNLHDGAQQRLLALSYDLRLVRTGALASCDEPLVGVLDGAAVQTAIALDELRELAHGIYPAILTEAGLAAALATLADRAALPVELAEIEPARQPPAVERTTYLLVAEAIGDAAGRDATYVRASVHLEGDRLVIVVADDGAHRSADLLHLTDRVGALGGVLAIGDTTLQAKIPCA